MLNYYMLRNGLKRKITLRNEMKTICATAQISTVELVKLRIILKLNFNDLTI